MPLNLFIIGPSGCGKSTQAKLIADKYKLTHLSTGQLLRDEIAAGTGFGLEAKIYIDKGTWVPDDLVFDVLIAKLKTIDYQNFIIDGFPRVLNQGKIIEYFLKKQQQPFSLLVHLDVTFEEITKRREVKGDEFQDSQRTDNTPELILSRQKTYDDTITPIKEYFSEKKLLFEVDGNRPVEPIFDDIVKKIETIK
ncbi:MAG: Adenylate kinase [Candidatus Shapirobacteria bacterium GW2011_GWE1_38_10]|uniref:Adenylate kinase n=1 Tax=Candidatus Shapirobacteria bacterium GW2011_GWE1_38_10 TaxID=1618488 RepID=A0A0G0KLW5_9BACT|nr:MAG: Adenylate kinase [Candidatus Shapirobacteria bacterium GW2011_GWF2_37_20]KKQ50159.1 MAG: Adenylate kinase [Candidatus Shapirobacteria bacterium GW2011_GWE1_38_10]KKQ64753.1 MAG: Adenylate kinase [Candidatus Shapirobacteria bacterium GW2011_GWF1_38_23]HBP50910.1 adenylate kinase [Candidatus Shapirobacteria bacterium]